MYKKYLFPTIAFLLLLTAGCAQNAQQAGKVYPYPFNSAKIEFTLTGTISGTRTLYIKGDKIANEAHVTQNSGGVEKKMDTTLLETDGIYYQIDLNSKTAIQTQNQIYETIKNLPEQNKLDYLVKMATGNAAPGSTMPIASEQKDIAGQKCDLYSIKTYGEVCLWNGIPLYSSIKIPDANIESVTTATKIETNIDLPDSIFALPADVKIQDQAATAKS